MNAHGFNLAEQGHVAVLVQPQDINGGVNGDRFHMQDHDHVSILLSVGVSFAAFTVDLAAFAAATGGAGTALGFRSYAEETSLGDVLEAGVDQPSTGFTTSANDNIFYVIEVSAEQLPKTSGTPLPYLELQLGNPGGATFVAAYALLSGSRYGGINTRSVLS